MLRHAISWSLTLIPFAQRRGSSTQSTISPLVVVVAAIRSTTAAADERAASPSLGDVAEQAMLDRVPLRGTGRIVADRDRQAGLVGQFRHLTLPQPTPRSIGAAAIGCDQQPIGLPIAHAPYPLMPGPNGVDRELGRVMVDAQADPV